MSKHMYVGTVGHGKSSLLAALLQAGIEAKTINDSPKQITGMWFDDNDIEPKLAL
jgi:predicted ATPase